MIGKIKLSLVATGLMLSTLNADHTHGTSVRDAQALSNNTLNKAVCLECGVDNIADMFKHGTISGQIRLGHISYDTKVANTRDTSATALGGQLKFETAHFNGVSLGAAVYTSQNINALSGDQGDGKFATDLSSSERNYTELAEAYINYNIGGFNFRGGRQLIDTPLADSDDIRMTPHTFEAYIASYSFDDLGLAFTAGNIQRWQGVDADYANVTNDRWVEAGEDGTWLGAVHFERDNIEASAWFYDVSKATTDSVANKAVYTDIAYSMDINEDIALTVAAQYLNESESDNSGVDGSIAGVMVEAAIGSLTLGAAYNRVSLDDGKSIFEGFGGGSSFTNMDTNTAGLFADGQYGDAKSYVLSASYDIAGANIFAAYGDFKADSYAAGANAQGHATEINVGVGYSHNEGEIEASLVYVVGEDKESSVATEQDDDHLQLTLNYNF